MVQYLQKLRAVFDITLQCFPLPFLEPMLCFRSSLCFKMFSGQSKEFALSGALPQKDE
jgi:hypothetical protein